MKLLKNFTVALLLLMVGISGFSCDHLAIDPEQSISNDAFFESMADFRSGIGGAYNQMQNRGWYGRTMPLVPDLMSEDVKQSAQANRYQEFADYEGLRQSGHQYERDLWREVYETINILNNMINAEEGFEPPSTSVTELNQLIGEAYAQRALAYFDLVRMYAQHYTFSAGASHPGVPIVTTFDVTSLPSRNTVSEVYTQIIADFNVAIGKMTMDRGFSQFSKEAAQALLSRVYLYMEDFTNSIAMADAVINSGRYSLVSAGSYLTMFSDGGSSEAILEVSNSPTDNIGSDSVGGMYRKSGYGDYLPALDLLNLIDLNDIRLGMFIFDPDLTGPYASMRVNKYPTTTNTDNVPVIRLSEVYLNRAEAYARSGNDAGAQADLNLIRQRGLSTAPDVTLTGDALLADILMERRIELANEGHRIFDITRHKMDVVRVDFTGDVGLITYGSPLSNFWIFPMPAQEVDVNPNIEQNPGY